MSSVLSVAGALLVADAALTLVWQEPISALRARLAQSRLDDRLVERERRYAPRADVSEASIRVVAARYRRSMSARSPLGRIEMPSLGRKYVVVEGTDAAALRQGPGHYPATALPGEGRTVAVAGHRTTYLAPFRTVNDLRKGDPIVVRMPYATVTYRVARIRIVAPTATWVTRDVGRERLVLTACHPLYSAKQRIVIFADRPSMRIRVEPRGSSAR